MDRICDKCGEPWDVYHMIHDAGGLEAIEDNDEDIEILEWTDEDGGKWSVYNVTFCSYEIAEGHFRLLECPCCERNLG